MAVGLALLLVALAVRAPALGSYSWPDELTWLERSAAFVTALERADLAGTYRSDHPGVVPMWGFGGLLFLRAWWTGDRAALDALAAESYEGDVPALLATAAWFTVLVTSLTVILAYRLLIPLLGRAGAALAGLLIALDPFFLTHSRFVHVDALLTSFMLLAVLSLLAYLRRPERRGMLFLSGFWAGLALLTKTPALFLIPLAALTLGLQWLLHRLGRCPWGRLGQALGAFFLWLATAWGTFVVLWPAAWFRPLYLTYRLYRASRWGVIVSHGSNFFLGRVVDDPGPLFYWVVLPFRLSPLVLVALLLGLVFWVIAWTRREEVRLPTAALAFIFFFTMMVSFAAKKGERYLLPVFPLADILAAWAMVTFLDRLSQRARDRARTQRLGLIAGTGLTLLVALLWLPLSPYYGAYFNPLLGGGPVAARTFVFGQGEGLDLAARYLNEKENSADLRVVTFYPPQFRYYFRGEATSLRRGDWDKTWYFADYVVFFISQVQRQLPTPELVEFFSAQTPEYVVRLGGVDFVWVYRSPVLLSGQPPAVERRLEDQRLGEELALVGYALSADRVRPGEELYATLDWQTRIQLDQDYEFEVLVIDAEGQVIARQPGPSFDGYFPTSWWEPGRTMTDRYRIPLSEDIRPGRYWLAVRAHRPGEETALPPHGQVHIRRSDCLLISPLILEP